MKKTIDGILEILKDMDDWITSAELADIFNVSSRTIRNYMNRITEDYGSHMIESSYRGYRLNKALAIDLVQADDNDNDREYIILRKLINHGSLDFFELADMLYISESTLDTSLKKLNLLLSSFSLVVQRHRNFLSLQGEERSIRKVINELINHDNFNAVISYQNSKFFNETIDAATLSKKLLDLFQHHDIYINDYGFNNILLHILISINRIQSLNFIHDGIAIDSNQNAKIYRIANDIKSLMESTYDIEVSNIELYHLTLILSSNSNMLDYATINSNNIGEFIEDEYINLTQTTIKKLEAMYYLDSFDQEFVIKLTIHIRNLFFRLKHNVFTRNPLAIKIKYTYPFVYDMAVFVANELKNSSKMNINHDEIAFIAFHIGSYLENEKNTRHKINTIFIYAEYHSNHKGNLDKIVARFGDDINIINVISIKDFHSLPSNIELIITSIPLADISVPIVTINIFATVKDLESIERCINGIKTKKRKDFLVKTLDRFIGKELFFNEFYAEDEFLMIQKLSKHCIDLQYASDLYTEDVLNRERLSSTSFSNGVAVPHALNYHTTKSFLSIVVNHRTMRWGNNDIHIIVLIGTSQSDRSIFRDIFNDLISMLYEPINVSKLLKCEDYTSFRDLMIELMIE